MLYACTNKPPSPPPFGSLFPTSFGGGVKGGGGRSLFKPREVTLGNSLYFIKGTNKESWCTFHLPELAGWTIARPVS